MKTITFYSYKGGTGRSLLLANTACFLARAGQHVVMLDFDLEAPGLHDKFKCRLPEKLVPGEPVSREQLKPGEIGPGSVDILYSWQNNHAVSVEEHIYDVTPENLKESGRVELIPAGPAPSLFYANLLLEINWTEIRDRIEAKKGRQIRLLKDELKARGVDYLLVDARTGITDVGALALHGIFDTDRVDADKTVCLFTTTPESINGIALVMAGLTESHGWDSVVPTLARIPNDSLGESKLLFDTCSKIQKAAGGSFDEGKSNFNIEVRDLVLLRSDPSLQVEEEILVENSERTVRESMIVLDYLNLFKRLDLPLDILSEDAQQVIDLYRDYRAFSPRIPIENGANTLAHARTSGLQYKPPSEISAAVFQDFIQQVVTNVCEVADLSLPSKESPPHMRGMGFDGVALRMRESMLHISGDLYYLTPARREIVDVLPFGRVERYGFIIQSSKDGPLLLPARQEAEGQRAFDECLLPALKSGLSDFSIGLLAESAATSEVFPQMLGHISVKRTYFAPSKEVLKMWMSENENAVVIGDLDVFATIGSLDDVNQLEFRRGHLAGLVYPLGDMEWKRILIEAVARFLSLVDGATWREIEGELKRVGVVPFAHEDLLRELLLDMKHKQAIDWLGRLGGFRA